ncbi:MAG: transposase, partial [Candidatus Acidiferrales bacterium]
EVRKEYGFKLVGYVVMPEHVHLLISEPARGNPSTVLKMLKQRASPQTQKRVGLDFTRLVFGDCQPKTDPRSAGSTEMPTARSCIFPAFLTIAGWPLRTQVALVIGTSFTGWSQRWPIFPHRLIISDLAGRR